MGASPLAPSTGTTGISRQFLLQFHLVEAYVFCTPTSRLAALPFLISYHIVSIEFFLLFATLIFWLHPKTKSPGAAFCCSGAAL
jgi:hypothetical protein